MRRYSVGVVVIIAILGTSACHRNNELASRPSSLILLPGSSEVKYTRLNGSDQLIYRLSVDYPANEVINEISTQLAKEGWQPMADDWLNAGQESSHSRGWTSFSDATTKPETFVFQWLAQWQDSKGNVVTYGFQYRDRARADSWPSVPQTNQMKVIGAYFPEKLAKQMMNWASEDHETPKTGQ